LVAVTPRDAAAGGCVFVAQITIMGGHSPTQTTVRGECAVALK